MPENKETVWCHCCGDDVPKNKARRGPVVQGETLWACIDCLTEEEE